MKEGFYEAKSILDNKHNQLISKQPLDIQNIDKQIREINK
ncbi:hypothetical protein Mgra_00001863 [Meloidogyne graminicola]|uniref:Uncharacterized protein n=1 Tax=Meloidogyne graminicola TaxID=189291 RepID=A0A8S9ZZP2_9BILA|nr:hypothetical protein Mgra_00001863 [Meloidogyne graminicola]